MRKPSSKRSATVATVAAETVSIPAVPAVETVTIATPDTTAAKAERIVATRAAIDAVFASLGITPDSRPVRSFDAATGSQRPATLYPHPNARKPSVRQAAALCAAAAHAGVRIDPTVPTFDVPRVFDTADAGRAFIENGCGRDIIRSGLATTNGAAPDAETLTVNFARLRAIIGEPTMRKFGILA